MSFIVPEKPRSLLGAMNFGTAWKESLGDCSKENAFEILDYFYQQGGNWIDTAVNYQFGESEQWIGEWMEARDVRDEMVIATKFTGMQIIEREKEGGKAIKSNYAGNSAKNIYTSLERSLKQLRVSYVDIYYLHMWDSTTSIPKLMHALNDLCTSRKVIYLGVSDTPAWIVVKANCYARQHGLRQFSVYQGRWSAADRSFEREIIPMALDEGMALAPWGALGGGGFKTNVQREANEKGGRNLKASVIGNEAKVSDVLEKIAISKSLDIPITSVALAYVMHKSPYVFPIVGGRKIAQLESNIEALGIRLTKEDIQKIDDAYGFEMGFPHSFLSPLNAAIKGPEDDRFINSFGHFDFVEAQKPIPPHEGPLDKKFRDIGV